MSYNVSSPVADASVATKAAKDGSDFTNPSTWRASLGVFSKDEIYGLSRAHQGGLAFDGVTTTAKSLHTIGADIGTSDFSYSTTFLCPASVPASQLGIISLASSSSGSVGYSFVVFVDTNDELRIILKGATPSDLLYKKLASFTATYGGKLVNVCVVRSASAVTLTTYVNGIAATTTEANAGAYPTWAGSVSSTYALVGHTGSTSFNSTIFSATLFNRALSASEVITLANQGVQEADKWGSLTATYDSQRSGGFDTGTDSFTADGTTIAGNVDGIGGQDNNLSITSTATTGNHRAFRVVPMTTGKKYRVSFSYYMSAATNVYAKQLSILPFSSSAYPITSPAEATWTTVTLPEFTFTGIGTTFIVRMADSGGLTTFTGNATDVVYIRGVTVTQIGSILDADLSAGVGYQVPDRSSNDYHGDISTTGVSHVIEKYDGHHTIIKTLAHSDISSTAATTLLCTLPKNCGIIEVEFDRGTAFDSGITVDVGISGTNAKFVSAQSLAATGKVLADSLSKVSESGTGNTSVYIKKSGSTTVGSTVVRVTYRIRNK